MMMRKSTVATGISVHTPLTARLKTSYTLISATTIGSAETPSRTGAGAKAAASKKGRFGTTDVRIASNAHLSIRVAPSRKETTARRPGGTVLTESL
jgi:hypothetical protein